MNLDSKSILCAASVLVPLLLADSALAGQHCVASSVPSQTTNWSTNVVLPRFDPSVGQLQSVQVFLTGRLDGSVQAENPAPGPATYEETLAAQLRVLRPNASLLVQVQPSASFTDAFAAYDGTLDFAGPSGATHIVTNVTDYDETTFSSAADLALFTGSAGNPGTITLGVEAQGVSTATGPGALVVSFQTTAGATQVEVCYHFSTPGGAFCAGDNLVGLCPCDPGQFQHGCANSFHAAGALLGATGNPSVSNDTVVLGAILMPNSSALFFQGTAASAGSVGVMFGDGIRCAGGTVTRLGTKTNVLGASSYPTGGDAPVSVRGNVPAAGGTRFYQVLYRNNVSFCTPATFNLTNGFAIVWGA